jgi:hypothetical protein
VTSYTVTIALTTGTTYYWQVRAVSLKNPGGNPNDPANQIYKYANNGTWFMFKTAP